MLYCRLYSAERGPNSLDGVNVQGLAVPLCGKDAESSL